MSDFTSIKSIQYIRVATETGQSTASLYGNGLNCVAVIISLLAMSANGPFDLESADLRPTIDMHNGTVDVHLTDYTTGKPLPFVNYKDGNGLAYTDTECKFPNPILTSDRTVIPGGELNDKRGSVTFYLYGKSDADVQRQVGVMVKLPSSKTVYANDHNSKHYKLDVTLKKPIRYTVADLEPLSWTQIWKKDNNSQMNAHVKMRRDIGSGWLRHDFKDQWVHPGSVTSKGRLCYPSRTTRNRLSHLFFYAPLGLQDQQLIEDRAYTHSHVLLYNQEPNALCIVYARIDTPGYEDFENFTDDVIIKLYDVYGNIGIFHLNYTDPVNPTIETQNFL